MKHAHKLISIAVLLALVLVFISGCGPLQTETPRVHEGTEGLSIEFMEKSPPDEVYVGDVFPVTLDMKNKGAYDIETGILVLGIEKEYVSVQTEEFKKAVSFDMNGRSLYDPIGGIDRKTIRLKAGALDPQSETHTTMVAVTTCYPYRTDASANVCIDTDIFGQRMAEKVCTPQTLKMGTVQLEGQELPRGQGAPIAITKIEQKMLPHEDEQRIVPQFMIYVKNMGDGLPVELSSYQDACRATGVSKGLLNVVGARVYLSDKSVQLNCKPKLVENSPSKEGYIKLEKKEDFIKCSLEEGVSKDWGTYTTPLIMELDYGYTFTISKNVLIRKQV